jgi:carboxyl-terminal processing protease
MKTRLKKNFLFFILFTIAIVLGMFLGVLYTKYKQATYSEFFSFLSSHHTKVNNILSLVKNKYVDSVNVDSMEDLAVNQILGNLDPHTTYLAPADAQQQNESLEGSFEGIGIEYFLLKDTILVTSVRPFGPAEKAGIQHGDKIVAVNPQDNTSHQLSAAAMLQKLRGKKGSEVQVAIVSNGAKARIVHIVRDKILVSSIDIAYIIDSKTGFIKLSKFGANTAEDFLDELQKMEASGIKNLILDLRDNGGGYLDAAIEMADHFLAKDKLIVYTQGLHEPRTYYKATETGLFENGNLALLIDENTASASEIVAGAIQDWGRGVIIGRRSFGKGLVQQQFVFNDGSAINLTVARYFTPSGRSIQKPYKNGNTLYKDELNQRLKKGEYTSLDSNLADTTAFAPHLKFKTATGKAVYASGGIMPDIFIPIDTLNHAPFYNTIINESLTTNFVYAKLIYQIKRTNYTSPAHFMASYHTSTQQYQQFIAYCHHFKVVASAAQIQKAKPAILKSIKAILIKYYYGEKAYYQYLNTSDTCIKAALKQFEL